MDETSWKALWEELHDQGDVGTASYAAIALIADVLADATLVPTHAYWLAAAIEIGWQNPYPRKPPFEPNPELPEWLTGDYFKALDQFVEWGLRDFRTADGNMRERGILALLAARKGFPLLADMCFLDEEELGRDL